MVLTKCVSCGKEFNAPPSWIKRGRGKFCSKDCCNNSKRGKSFPGDRWANGRPKVLRTFVCKQCGGEIIKDGDHWKNHTFCSKKCDVAYKTGKNHPMYRGGPIEKECPICHSIFKIKKSFDKDYKTCGNKTCRETYFKQFVVKWGADHHNCDKEFLASHGFLRSFEPYCPKFNKTFKERVRAYFGYECIECGTPQNGYKLHVHHVHYNKLSCCDPNVPKMFVPLCRSCHTKTNHGNRDEWRQHFEQLIISYYGGCSYYTQEEWDRMQAESTAQ